MIGILTMGHSAEFEYEIIEEANGCLMYGHYLEDERSFKVYDHKNNKYRMSYNDVDRENLNIIGKKKVTIANPAAEGEIGAHPVVLAAAGITKRKLEDKYISRWELSDGLAQYYLKKMSGGPPRDGDKSGIGVITFESDKKNTIHVVTYRRNADDDMLKIDEFDHDLAGGMIYSGRIEEDQMIYTGGVRNAKVLVTRKITAK